MHPEPNKRYIIGADVARGDGTDYSAFHIIDVDELEQVAEFKSKIDTTRYAGILASIGTEYNDAVLVVENNNVGWAVLQVLLDREYRNLFWMNHFVLVHEPEDLGFLELSKIRNQSKVNYKQAIDLKAVKSETIKLESTQKQD